MKAIMYHYVQEFNEKLPYFHYLNIKNFEKQIIYFKSKYEFFDCNDIENFSESSKIRNKILLTFDDGLICHSKYVLKVLQKYNLNGIFYIPTGPYLDGKILDVHKIHLIIGKIGGLKAFNLLQTYIDNSFLDLNKVEEYEKHTYKLQVNSDYINSFKRILNYYIKYEFREDLVNRLFGKCFNESEKNIIKRYYMSITDIKNLYSSGMVIGSHAVKHKLMSRLPEKSFKQEIDDSFNFLNDFINYKTFCYPYGGDISFNNKIEKYLDKNLVEFSLSVESRNITKNDLKFRRQALPRFDCNQFKYGQIDIV